MTSETENNKKLEEFFGREYHLLKAYVNSKIKDSVARDAEDIIQDVALKLFSNSHHYSPINNVAGFVYHSIRNKIIDVIRTAKPGNRSHEENESKLIEFAEILYGKPDNSYSEQLKSDLKQTIMGLKPHYRDIIIAVDFEGYSYKEISLETGISEGTLMSRRHRAISLLYKNLKHKKV
ncbi:RNA polymerase sigma factor [Spongiimicrobium sp. 3-5]|uniref:RNA polymerase sigma factor n=1 Tax=Spongiimicrobium sp. 3-5 TaxID=3332596 RepID=UPI003981878B